VQLGCPRSAKSGHWQATWDKPTCGSSSRSGETPRTVGGAAPIWSPFFAGLTQSTPHPVGIEVLSIDWRAGLLPPRLIEPSGIDSGKAEFINKL
jgi:hypothetical protein